ncbi:MAG: metal ABC transporter solute-binding protein, Zn/Mn family [Ardenticatenaceae bacterium]
MKRESWTYFSRLFIALILLTMLAACSSESDSGGDSGGKLKVVATTGQITDALLNIGGDAIDLTGLFGPGVDPHLYVPTEGDVTTLAQANAIFYGGLHLEAQMTRAMEEMSKRGITVVSIGDNLPSERLLNWEANTPYDPHIWNDPQLWKMGVELMRDTLIERDSDNAELYRTNTDTYLAEIDETDQYVQEQIARIPDDKRVMITAHDAFGYFARTYGLEVRGLQGISTESEASTAEVQELASLIVERQIPAIFVETSVPPRTIEAVQAAVQAQGFQVEIGGELFSDALGNPGTPEGTYPGMLRHNAKTLADALSK